jgi:hypothetical protein
MPLVTNIIKRIIQIKWIKSSKARQAILGTMSHQTAKPGTTGGPAPKEPRARTPASRPHEGLLLGVIIKDLRRPLGSVSPCPWTHASRRSLLNFQALE